MAIFTCIFHIQNIIQFKLRFFYFFDFLQRYKMNNNNNLPEYLLKTQIPQGAVVIITGASSGLGKQLAIKLSKLPITLVLTGRNAQRLELTKKSCQSFFTATVMTLEIDVTEQSACQTLINKVIEKYHKIDVLILNAGINAHFHFGDLKDLSVYDQLMKTNFYANVYLTKYALTHLRKSKGFIVVISSISGKLGLPERSAYCASKFALNGFFQSLRTQQDNISIFMVYPTSLDTPMRNNDILGSKQVSHNSTNKQQSAEKTAENIIAGIRKGQKDLYIPGKLWLGTFIQPLFPGFMRNKVKQAAKL